MAEQDPKIKDIACPITSYKFSTFLHRNTYRNRQGWDIVIILGYSFPLLLPSNGFLERIFSACTWFDNLLYQRLKDKQLEMVVLVTVNNCLITGVVSSKEKVKDIVASDVAQFDKEGNLPVLGIDLEADNFLDSSLE